MKTKKTNPAASSKEKKTGIETRKFPIVGIGASAGGLEALEQLLGDVSDNSGMAYVVVQHLDPTQKGMLPELLQRISKMKVLQVKEGMPVKPNCIYVIPSNKSMSILKGVLYLFEPAERRGMRLPIDFFLRSLADDQKEYAIGIILSGMGSDGSSGIKAIKEKDGIVVVQDPETAKFDSMPRNAIDSGLIDIIAPPNEIHAKLIDFINHIPDVQAHINGEGKNKSALEKIIILLRTHTGNDFSMYKKNTIYRRIERRMGVHKIDKINSYIHFLQENPEEIHILFKEMMIGVTNFFRDAPVWEELKKKVFKKKLGKDQGSSTLRAWIPGSSTGEEAYSLAIVFKEALEELNLGGEFSLQIFATDLDNDAIEAARKGIFPKNIEADVSSKRLSRFFTKTDDDGYRINTEIRETIVFAQHNLIMHPPFTNIDIISCRNLLIYLDSKLQKKLLGLFFYSLNPEGILLLGSSETLGLQGHLFTSENSSLKIYKRAYSNLNTELSDFPSSFSRSRLIVNENKAPEKPIKNIQALVDQLLLNQFSTAGVLVNEKGDILYISGRTGKYLEPAVGKANLNIFAMLRPGFQNNFAIAFRKVLVKKEAVVLNHVKMGTNGGSLTLNVNILWIDKPEPLAGKVLIIFTDAPKTTAIEIKGKTGNKNKTSVRETELEEELQHAREEVQNIAEEMQTSQEELKSANEELQSTNEELQSANEELTTSKEEMQSLNEELQTVNAELKAKVDEYSRINNDMKNLLNSTDIATLFLDKELNIRRYTNQATKIFKLIKSDIGRPFTDQTSHLIYSELADDALEVLRTLIFIEKQIPTKEGRWFRIRIMPYRTFDDRIDGLVITFIDISKLKQVGERLQKAKQENQLLLESSSSVIIKLSPDWEILEFNPLAETFFGRKRKEVTGENYMELFIPESLQKNTEQKMNKMFKKSENKKIKMKVIAAGEKELDSEWSVSVLFDNSEIPSEIILTTQNR
ncbi:MAG: chemotaxis protein CheB [Bacteroidota bacterium]|nr:chemotaxis protein CheB [Bacteroidota bacterium]